MNEVLDLRGLSCPIPLLRTKEALAGIEAVEVLVDEAAPRENIMKFARSQGYQVAVVETEGAWQLKISRV